MKIYAISPFTYQNINKTEKNTGYYFSNVSADVVSFSTKKPVSFGNKVEHTLVKLQARDLENKTGTVLKDSTSIKQEAYLLRQDTINIKKDAKVVLENGKDLFLSIKQALIDGKKNSFNPVQNEDGYTVRMFKHVSNGEIVIEEFSDVTDEDASRIVSIKPDTTSVYDTDTKTGETDIYIFDTKSGHMKKYAQNAVVSNKGYSAEKQYTFDDNGLVSFDIGHKVLSNKSKKSDERFIFNSDGALKQYYSDYCKKSNGTVTSSEQFDFEGKRLKQYSSMGMVNGKYSAEFGEIFIFARNSDLKVYAEGYSKAENGEKNAELFFVFGDDSIEDIYVGYTVSDSNVSAKKLFSFVEGFADTCTFDFNKSNDGKITYSNKIKI